MKITFDVETTGLHHKKDSLLSLSCLFDNPNYGLIPTNYTDLIKENLSALIELFPDATFIGHNIKFDLRFLDVNPDVVDEMNLIDTTILYHYLFPREEKKLGSIEKHLFKTQRKNEYLEKYGKKFDLWPEEELEIYNRLDVELTYAVYKKLINHVDTEFLTYQNKFLKELYRIEYFGIGFDESQAKEETVLIEELSTTKEEELRDYIWTNYGYSKAHTINFNSSKQLSELLYIDLDIPKPNRNNYPNGVAFDKLFTSTLTNADLLETIKNPFVEMFLDWKKVIAVQKSIQSYADLSFNDRLYPSFNITGTRTGRISCSSPNLQNISKDRKGLPSVRTLFRPNSGESLVSIDYQQQEIRMLAILSQDENLLNLVKQGVDMHTVMGKQMFRKDEITKEERDQTKAINFGIIYGLSISAVAFKIGSDVEYADNLVNTFYENFPDVKVFMDNIRDEADQMGGITLFTGRKWECLPGAAYQAVNAVIQGSCAELTGLAVIRVSNYLKNTGKGSILSIIHDEILYSLNDDSCIPEIVSRMQMPELFGIPFLVDIDISY